MKRILVIIGSVRPTRVGEQIAAWVTDTAGPVADLIFEVIDLKAWHLPLDDEPDQPAHGEYLQPHTKAWSETIATADGFIFVTPQYNWGYPAALKNALDHLYREWRGKPAVIVSYGHRGGTRASGQLAEVLQGLKMQRVATAPALSFSRDQLDADGRLRDPASSLQPHDASMILAINQLIAELSKADPK